MEKQDFYAIAMFLFSIFAFVVSVLCFIYVAR